MPPRQVRAAPAARRRRELEPLVRVIDQPHRRPRVARLLPRPPFPPLPQRPVRALLLIRAVRRRRPRRRGRIPAHLTLQILHLGGQAPDLRGQLADQPVRLRQPRRQLRSGRADSSSAEGTPGTSGTQAMITIPARQSTTRPGVSSRQNQADYLNMHNALTLAE